MTDGGWWVVGSRVLLMEEKVMCFLFSVADNVYDVRATRFTVITVFYRHEK